MLKTRQSLIEYRYEYVDMNCFSCVPNIHGHLPLSPAFAACPGALPTWIVPKIHLTD